MSGTFITAAALICGLLSCVRASRSVRMERYFSKQNSVVWAVCNPDKPEIYLPADAAVQHMNRGQARDLLLRDIDAIAYHEAGYLVATMPANSEELKHFSCEVSRIAVKYGIRNDEVLRLFKIIDSVREEMVVMQRYPGISSGFRQLVADCHDVGGMAYCRPVPGENHEQHKLDRFQLFVLLYVRFKFTGCSALEPDELAARYDLTDLIGNDRVSKIEGLISKSVSIGEFNDGRNLFNTEQVLNILDNMLDLLSLRISTETDQPGSGLRTTGCSEGILDDVAGHSEPADGNIDSSVQINSEQKSEAERLRKSQPEGNTVHWDPSRGDFWILDQIISPVIGDAVIKAATSDDGSSDPVPVKSSSASKQTGKYCLVDQQSNWNPPIVRGSALLRQTLIRKVSDTLLVRTGSISSHKLVKAYMASMAGRSYDDCYRTIGIPKDLGHDFDVIVDTSSPMMGQLGITAITAAWTMWKTLFGVKNTTVRMTGFSDSVTELIPVRTKQTLRQIAECAAGWGETRTDLAVRESTYSLMKRHGRDKVQIIITGSGTNNIEDTARALRDAKARGIRTILVGIGTAQVDSYSEICRSVSVSESDLISTLIKEVGNEIQRKK